jgi:hypothetical protein
MEGGSAAAWNPKSGKGWIAGHIIMPVPAAGGYCERCGARGERGGSRVESGSSRCKWLLCLQQSETRRRTICCVFCIHGDGHPLYVIPGCIV